LFIFKQIKETMLWSNIVMSEFFPEPEIEEKTYIITPEQKEKYMETKIMSKEKTKEFKQN